MVIGIFIFAKRTRFNDLINNITKLFGVFNINCKIIWSDWIKKMDFKVIAFTE